MAQRVPSKPDYLSDSEYSFILNRDQRRCAFFGRCPDAGARAYCDENLHFDHAQPVELGGDHTAGNIRLLCANINCGRPVEPLAKWTDSNFFDSAAVPGRLRNIQVLAGWDAITELVDQGIIADPHELRRRLLGVTTFLAGATGIGKTVLALSVLLRLNTLIGCDYPRAKFVLWLTNDTTLRDTGRKELESDIVDIGFAGTGPSVQIAQSFSDIELGPNGADIKISAAQSLWKVEINGVDRRSDDEIRRALLLYDTIIFDEADWANDQMRRIAQLGGHCLQFALTATPLIGDENFLRRFVLISPNAIADYERAQRLDQCLKFIGDVTVAGKYGGFQDRKRGVVVDHHGERLHPDHVLFRGAITQAIVDADRMETRMRNDVGDDYYSPHLMVRMSRVADVKAMREDLAEQLDVLYQRGELRNPGWRVSMIFQGHSRDANVSYDERDLARKDRFGHWKHPFMLARNLNGHAHAESMRILLMCNIGVRGINNWTISHICDCTDIIDERELNQFDHGRPLRWPNNRADWIIEGSPLAEFASTHIFIPDTDLGTEKRDAINAARNSIYEMLPRIGGAGFLTWSDLLTGRDVTDADVQVTSTTRALTDEERFQVQGCLGAALAAVTREAITPEAIPGLVEAAIDQHGELRQASERIRERLLIYGQRLLATPEFRRRELTSAPILARFENAPASVIEKLKPQDMGSYDVADLKRWVKTDASYDGLRDDYQLRLNENDRVTIHAVSKDLRDRQIANYRPAARTRRLHGERPDEGVLPEVGRELIGKLNRAGQMTCEPGKVQRATIYAANKIFQISAENGGPMDFPAYHIAIIGRYRDTLQAIARSKLITDGELGPHLQRFANL
jgi:hypothetical protein